MDLKAESEEELIGTPVSEVPMREPGEDCNGKRWERREEGPNIFLGYCGNPAGKGTDHVGSGRCKFHGGNNPSGEDHPNFEHGLYSDVLSEDDREDLAAIEAMDNAVKLQSMINYELLRIRRAVGYLEGSDDDDRTFWDAFEEIMQAATETGIESDDIRELAGMLDSGNQILVKRMSHIRRLIKTYHEITEGKQINIDADVEQRISGGDEPLEITWKETPEEESD